MILLDGDGFSNGVTRAILQPVLSTQTMLRLLRFRFAAPFLLYSLLLSGLLLADAYSLLILAPEYGVYFVLAAAGSVSLIGVITTVLLLGHQLRVLRRSVYLSASPWTHYRNALALFCGGLFFLSPGAVSSALALVCMLPVIREIPGLLLTVLARDELEPVYDFLKIEDSHATADSSADEAPTGTSPHPMFGEGAETEHDRNED